MKRVKTLSRSQFYHRVRSNTIAALLFSQPPSLSSSSAITHDHMISDNELDDCDSTIPRLSTCFNLQSAAGVVYTSDSDAEYFDNSVLSDVK